MKDKILQYREWLVATGVGIGVLLLCVAWAVLSDGGDDIPSEEQEWVPTVSSTEPSIVRLQESRDRSVASCFVDVKGAVKQPGLYQVTTQMRVWDALQLAGGLLEDADERQINFSQKVEDQMVIYVPLAGEVVDQIQPTAEREGEADDKIDLNTADQQRLMTLSGIGEKKAQEIIRYRETNGGFASIEELANIPGIGGKTIEKLSTSIYVS